MVLRAATVCGLVFAVGVSPVLGGTVDMRFVGFGAVRGVKATMDGQTRTVLAGQLIHEFSNGTGDAAGLTGRRITYCTEIFTNLAATSKTYELLPVSAIPTPAMGNAKAAAIKDLYDYAGGYQKNPHALADFTAAFQIAIWEIINDYDANVGRGSLGISTGNLRFTNPSGFALPVPLLTFVDTLFNQIGRAHDISTEMGGLANKDLQDQLIDEIPPIPLPNAAAMGAAGLALVVFGRRRR